MEQEEAIYKFDIQINKSSKDGSILGKVHDFKQTFTEHERLGYNYYKKSPLTSICDREVEIFNRHKGKHEKVLMFGSNNYLGAIAYERAINKAIEVTKEFGIGSGGVPALSGTTIYHNMLEDILSALTGFEDTMLFSSGFTANLGLLSGLARPNNLIIHDRLNHASLFDGSVMSGAKMTRYKHNDAADLEKLLKANHELYPSGIIVVTDAVFSMDGDIANIPALLDVVKRYNAILVIDEAHSTGVIGKNGAGILSYFGIEERENIILTGCLSKALGSVGGYISASKEIIDYLRAYARSNLYSTSLPPSVCASAIEVLNYMKNSDIVEELNAKAEYLRDRLRENGFNILDTVTAVIPIVVGDEYKLTMMSKDLLDKGIYISTLFAPVVPVKLCRLRINVMATITKDDMDYFIETLNELSMKYEWK
jgi:8-amino-7-oxononanoate synthase